MTRIRDRGPHERLTAWYLSVLVLGGPESFAIKGRCDCRFRVSVAPRGDHSLLIAKSCPNLPGISPPLDRAPPFLYSPRLARNPLAYAGHSAPDRMDQLYALGEQLGRWRVARN